MLKKFMLCLALVLVLASASYSSTQIWDAQDSIADLVNGRSDYSNARFSNFWFTVLYDDTNVTKETAALTGTITLSGGNYTFWNGKSFRNSDDFQTWA